MPQEFKKRSEVLEAIKGIKSVSDLVSTQDGHYVYELDLEVIVYGRNYKGKKVGPYVRLFKYDAGEAIIRQGDWGGNTMYVVVDGATDVFVRPPNAQREIKVAELAGGTQFGEMSVLAGVPRNATVRAGAASARILEIQRPALRLLRKLPQFRENLDRTYRAHGRDSTIEELKAQFGLDEQLAGALKAMSSFKVFSKNHVLFRERGKIDNLYVVKQGWLRRNRESAEDYQGAGSCFGIEGVIKDSYWLYSATLLARSEILEISIAKLRLNHGLREAVVRTFSRFAPPEMTPVANMKLAAQKRLIETGLVDATNLLVMDMDLCVRCGNCSLACHKIHGQSRLVRRGINVTRVGQSILSPEVCMHCKDPECLTGCPTGAIGRFGDGQIDIDPKTCIGCSDCATQCPYNAVSMTLRKRPDAPKQNSFVGRLRDLLRAGSEALPAAVDATDDLVAVKCNLCSDRESLNPPKSPDRRFSCEENCPTGALARVNPAKYFEEIGEIEGLLLFDPSHAAARKIHKTGSRKRWLNALGVLITILFSSAAIAAIAEYGLGNPLLGFLNMRWITGLVGLIGIAGVMTYPVRRQIYRRRAGPLRYWMLCHAYLGVIAGIMILLHGGADSGGVLTTALTFSYDVVILTGIFGILCYYLAPRLLTKIEESPLLIEDLQARRDELRKEIASAASSSHKPAADLILKVIVPRFNSLRSLIAQYFKREPLEETIKSARLELASRLDEALRRAANEIPRGSVASERARLDRAVEAAATLRRIDALVYLHRLLKLWLPPHIASTSLMLALMIVHIIQVIYYG